MSLSFVLRCPWYVALLTWFLLEIQPLTCALSSSEPSHFSVCSPSTSIWGVALLCYCPLRAEKLWHAVGAEQIFTS